MSAKPIRIHRAPHDKENPYYMVRRDTAQDKTLSYEALGVLNYILSKSDDWEVQPADLERKGCGRNRVYRLLKELITAKYIERIINYDSRHRVTSVEYIAHEKPYEKPLPTIREVETQEVETRDTEIPEVEIGHITKYREEENTENTSAPDSAVEVPVKAKPRDPWYDAVQKVWGYTAARNTIVAQMLQGTARQKGYKEYNLEKPITPDELLAWSVWYKRVKVKGNPKLSMIEEPCKVQSSIGEWQALQKQATGKILTLDVTAADYPDAADFLPLDEHGNYRAEGA